MQLNDDPRPGPGARRGRLGGLQQWPAASQLSWAPLPEGYPPTGRVTGARLIPIQARAPAIQPEDGGIGIEILRLTRRRIPSWESRVLLVLVASKY
jgi:hypothetical protein